MSNKTVILHFALGPVQGFVGQARRTRDLWAGSYLLSYLAGHAMKAVKDGGGNIVIPWVNDDPLYLAITDPAKRPSRIDDPAASVGSLLNRFKAAVPEGVDGKVCAEAITKKWNDIAKEVKVRLDDILDATRFDKNKIDEIWSRQIPHHWDCVWVISEDDSALDIRKNLRNHHTPPEPGEKCTVCGERQEISGLGMGSKESREKMREFWDTVREQIGKERKIKKATLFDLKENERLCAVCLVKRAFPFPEIAKAVIGWEVPVNYPSTSYMAAVDWIRQIFKACQSNDEVKGKVKDFLRAAINTDVWQAEAATRIKGITDEGMACGLGPLVINNVDKGEAWKIFADLDGDAFFKSAIGNPREFEVAGDAPPSDPKWVEKSRENPKRKALEDALGGLQKALPEKSGQPREATPFYALLLMDGDNMGKLLSGYKAHQDKIAKALAVFTQDVPKIVLRCSGKLIYAGGDDVFALLPLDRAIECAKCCREAYMKAFDSVFGADRTNGKKVPQEHETTISAAIEYAHMQTALTAVVRDAHKLLDEIAKTQCGRDGLACRVWKRGGPVLTWAQPWDWEQALSVIKPASTPPLIPIVDEVKYLFQDDSSDAGRFSSKFFYKMRDFLDLLAPGGVLTVPEDTAKRILATEYLANRDLTWPGDPTAAQKRVMAENRVSRLLALCRGQHRKIVSGAKTFEPGSFSADGALLVRFLSQKEV